MPDRMRQLLISLQFDAWGETSDKDDVLIVVEYGFTGTACTCPISARVGIRCTLGTIAVGGGGSIGVTQGPTGKQLLGLISIGL